MATAEDGKETKDKDTQKESREGRYPSPEVAEARIKQALLRYRVVVDRVAAMQEEKKVRL